MFSISNFYFFDDLSIHGVSSYFHKELYFSQFISDQRYFLFLFCKFPQITTRRSRTAGYENHIYFTGNNKIFLTCLSYVARKLSMSLIPPATTTKTVPLCTSSALAWILWIPSHLLPASCEWRRSDGFLFALANRNRKESTGMLVIYLYHCLIFPSFCLFVSCDWVLFPP